MKIAPGNGKIIVYFTNFFTAKQRSCNVPNSLIFKEPVTLYHCLIVIRLPSNIFRASMGKQRSSEGIKGLLIHFS